MAFYKGRPVHLVHNKFDPLMIDPADPEIRAWVGAATASTKTQFLNGLGAVYLTEAKRILALLSDPTQLAYLDPEAELARSTHLVPFTTLVTDWSRPGPSGRDLRQFLADNKDQFVLKADALTRGAGVTVGSSVDAEAWSRAIEETSRNNGVVQQKVATPQRRGLGLDQRGDICHPTEYYGIDLFLLGDEFAGAVSRCHSDIVFNIGNGGKESPVLIVRNEAVKSRSM
jgi:hypothetical protein